MENLIRQTAIKWWRDMSMIDQSFITQKYSTLLHGRGASSLTSREIEMLYLKEHSTEVGGEIGDEQWTDVIKRMSKIPEAEVSKEEETVEQAAMKYENRFHKIDEMGETICGYLTTDRPTLKECFAHGAAWQKEKDRELIEELKSSLEYLLKCHDRDYMRCELKEALIGSKESITKAEQHIKK